MTLIIADLDNTLYSWIDFFAPSFRALTHAISRTSGVAEDDLYSGFQMTFQREGTVEFRNAIQRNVALATIPEGQLNHLVSIGGVAFGRTMRLRLKPYVGVKSTLIKLREHSVRVVVVTNSDAKQAAWRIRQMGLAKLVDGLVATRDDGTSSSQDPRAYDAELERRRRLSGLKWVELVEPGGEKPSTSGYLKALSLSESASGSDVFVVGDSKEKDLRPALELGFHTVWARYGLDYDAKNFETLLRVTHWSAARVHETYREDMAVDYEISSFAELLDIVPGIQLSLF